MLLLLNFIVYYYYSKMINPFSYFGINDIWPRGFVYKNISIDDNEYLNLASTQVKLNPLREAVKGKRVIMIDDSIVRGTTSDRIINMLREAGAKEVHMRAACPPVMFACKYLQFTRATPNKDLLARKVIYELEGDEGEKHLEEYSDPNTKRGKCLLESICKELGFDSLGYQTIDGLLDAIGLDRNKVCTYCWTGKE
jgi:amidophosphoribosyltransferase